MSLENCSTCRFFLGGSTQAEAFAHVGGMCRRYAPTGPVVFNGGSWQAFPPVPPGQWCGDYRSTDYPAAASARMVA